MAGVWSGRLRPLSGHRVQRADGDLRSDADYRRYAAGHHAQRQRSRHCRAGQEGKYAQSSPVGTAEGQTGFDFPRGNRGRYQRVIATGITMATATAQRRARAPLRRQVKEFTYLWEGFDRSNRSVRGEMKAASETVVTSNLRRQGIRIVKLRKQTFRGGRRVNEKNITFFTRQLATMLKACLALLQAFQIAAPGHSNARRARLLMDIKGLVQACS